jgi:hypothetical protein
MGIKQAEETIIKKAREDSKKIEEYKIKLRQSAMGGVITNNLTASLDRIKLKHTSSTPQTQSDQLL